jgi:hypothetical protein
MPMFRKKPVVIEAFRWNPSGAAIDVPHWFMSRFCWDIDPRQEILKITTLEGVMEARPGDWIIKGVKGEIYPCKPDIFEATYEAVEA